MKIPAHYLLGLMISVLLVSCGEKGSEKETGAVPIAPPPIAAPAAAYTISGTVKGLAGSGLVIQNNGADNKTISENGAFTFATPLADGASYKVTILTQPTGAPPQICTVANGSGALSGANITNVTVTCVIKTYTISGTVKGLAGSGLVLQNNASNNKSINADGTFTFTTPIASGSGYNVTVLAQPANLSQTCVVNNGSGTVGTENVTNVTVDCTTNSYTIRGTVGGLEGTGLVLLNNGGDELSITKDSNFNFNAQVLSGGKYNVTVKAQPSYPFQTCTVAKGAGMVTNADITNIVITCVTNTYTIGGTVTGLKGKGLVLHNGKDHMSIYANGEFTFATAVKSGETYSVSVPTQPESPTQTCIVSNGSGTVVNANITNVAVKCVTNTYTISVTVSGLNGRHLTLQNNGGNDLHPGANGVHTFTVPIESGETYNVTVHNNPSFLSQTCTVSKGSGMVTNFNITDVAVNCITNFMARFAYVANAVDNTISLYTVNPGNGHLRANGYVIAGALPLSITVDPAGKFAYVTNYTSNNISVFAINASTGALTSVGAPVAAGTNPSAVSIDPAGKFAYVANYTSNNVSAYSINAKTGALTSAGTAPAGTAPRSVTIDPSGKFAYVANINSNNISAYAINAKTGALTSAGTVAAGTNPYSITFDPTGQFVYVANNGSNNISAYSINASTGALKSLGAAVAAGKAPRAVTVDPTGKFAYVANSGSNDVSAYSININTGVLTSLGEAKPAGTYPTSVSVDASGKYAYVTNYTSDDVSLYYINATSGALSFLGTMAARTGGTSIALTQGRTRVNYTPKFAFVANNGSNNVSAYTINASTGELTSVGAPVGAGTFAYAVSVDPLGQFAYVANGSANNVSAYGINPGTGALTSLNAASSSKTGQQSVTVDPSGKFAYVANYDSHNISAYIITPGTGTLTSAGAPVASGKYPQSITVDPTGKFAYVANLGSSTVSAYSINPRSGALTSVGPDVPTGKGPRTVAVDPTGKFVYVANSGSNDISAYTINARTGALTSVGDAVAAGTYPIFVTVDPLGRFVYSANFNSNDVSSYTIDPNTGALSSTGTLVASGNHPASVVVDPSGKFAYVVNNGSHNVSAYIINARTGALSNIGEPVPAGVGPFSIATFGTIQ